MAPFPLMNIRTANFLSAALLLALSAFAFTQRPAHYFPVMEVEAPKVLRLLFVYNARAGLESCEALLGSMSRSALHNCPTCRIARLNCRTRLEEHEQQLLSGSTFNAPAAHVPNGAIGFLDGEDAVALATCQATERQSGVTAKCYKPGATRPPVAPGRNQFAPQDFFWLSLSVLSALAAAIFLFGGVSGRRIPRPRELHSAVLGALLHKPRRTKQLIILFVDVTAVVTSLWFAFALRLEQYYLPDGNVAALFVAAPILAVPIFVRFGLYHAIMRFLGTDAVWAMAKAVTLYTALFGTLVFLIGAEGVPRSIVPIHGLLVLILIGLPRLIAREWFNQIQFQEQNGAGQQRKPVLIYGAGSAGAQLASALALSRESRPIAFVDDDAMLHGQKIAGLKVHGPADVQALVQRHGIADVLLAIPSISRQRRNEIIALLEHLPVHVRTLPAVADLAQGKVQLADLREVEIEDLLGRDPIEPQQDLLARNIRGKAVMVTGAGGSIGSELCRQISQLGATTLVLYENNEYALYAIELELSNRKIGSLKLQAVLGSVLDRPRMEQVIAAYGIQTIFHAAAYKHVPMVERNPTQGVINNIFGTWRTANAAAACGVETFVLISTDKAVRPTNTMGATKRLAEMALQSLHTQKPEGTRFTMVRFGNVLGSSGSVIPLFRQQIRNGGPVTVTDPRIIRYFMTIPEAAELVIQAGAMGHGGDVFVLDMGEPVKILDLAKRKIRLHGLRVKDEANPHGDIEIVFTGLRPGEKLYEELLIGDNVAATDHPRIMRANETCISAAELDALLAALKNACDANDSDEIRRLLQRGVAEFAPQCGNEDLLAGDLHPPSPGEKLRLVSAP